MEVGRLTEDTKGFVGVFFQEFHDFVEVEIVVVFDNRFSIVELVIVGVTHNFADGEGGCGANEEFLMDQLNEIFQDFILIVDTFGREDKAREDFIDLEDMDGVSVGRSKNEFGCSKGDETFVA
jgi:hypothetical protein